MARRRVAHKVLGVSALVVLSAAAGMVGLAGPAAADAVTTPAELRAAIDAANSSSDPTTIDLVAGTTYTFSGDECGDGPEDDNESGDLDLRGTADVILEVATGAPATIQMSCPGERVIQFQPESEATLTLKNLVITGGDAQGDDVDDSIGGGVVAAGGDLVLDHTTVTGNRANTNGTGFLGGSGGGVVIVEGALTGTNSTITNNQAGDGTTGAAGECPAPTIAGAAPDAVSLPDAGDGGLGGWGGGLLVAEATVDLTNSTVSGNTAGDGGDGGTGGAACSVEAPGGSGGDAGFGGFGGGIAIFFGGGSITGSTLSGNSAGDGGQGGSGGDGGTGTGDASGGSGGFAGNGGLGGSGGAIFDIVGGIGIGADVLSHIAPHVKPAQAEPTLVLTITNSTIDANSSGNGGAGGAGGDGGAAGPQGGQQGAGGEGGNGGCGGAGGAVSGALPGRLCGLIDEVKGLQVSPNQVEGEGVDLVQATITDNGQGGVGGTGGADGAGTSPAVKPAADGEPGSDGPDVGGSLDSLPFTATGTVVGDSTGGVGPDCTVTAAESSDSLDGDGTCEMDLDSADFADLHLGALGNHGGTTDTRVPGAGSVLIDVIAPDDVAVTTDQRGFARPIGTAGDVGAVEVQATLDTAVTKTASATSVGVGQAVTFTISVKNLGPGVGQAVTVDDPTCSAPQLTGGDTNANGLFDPNETWTYTCSATPTAAGTLTNTATVSVTPFDNAAVVKAATATVTVSAAELPATGAAHLWLLVRWALALIGLGTVLVLQRPFGRHFRPRWHDTGRS